ncbi:MAG: Crp/Fnr family transcriptional regulator [Pseudomonadota bacterium]
MVQHSLPDVAFAEQSCADCPIRYRAVCAHCEGDELAELERMKAYRGYAPGQTILWAGERMGMVGSIVTGVATLSRTLADGRRQMVGLLLPSDFVGRPGRDMAPYDVIAATDVTLCTFRKSDFERLLAQTPSLERRLLELTLDELDAAREWMLLLGRKTAREKIATLLAILARRDAALRKTEPADGMSFVLPIQRGAMADYLGLTIETVSRQISALRRDQVIALEDTRRIRVPSYARLVEEAGNEDEFDAGLEGDILLR